jgi:hypothetical protein
MKRSSLLFILAAILIAANVDTVAAAQNTESPDPYKATLDRLQSLLQQSQAEWRFHTDVPHPEDPGLNDSGWDSFTVRNVSGPGGDNPDEQHFTGTNVFRRLVTIPQRINGYATQGSRVLLDLRFGSPDSLMITVFSNGAILYRGDDDNILPVLLAENAEPGQRFLVAARVVAGDQV